MMPEWLAVIQARSAAAPIPIKWSHPLFVSPLADVPALCALVVALGEALEALIRDAEGCPMAEAGCAPIGCTSSDACPIGQALERYRRGPEA